MTAIRELLPAYALGALDDDEAARVTTAVAADAELAAELDGLIAIAGELGAMPLAMMPHEGLRARLLESVGGERFARFTAAFAAMFDVGLTRARELLGMIDRPASWERGPAPQAWFAHFTAGPALATADTGFIRLERGARFAWHRHHGDERCLVLQGVAEDSISGTLRAGDECRLGSGTEHDFVAVGDDDLIIAVWVRGVEFGLTRPDPA